MSSFCSNVMSCSHSCNSRSCFTCEIRRILDKYLNKRASGSLNISRLRELLAKKYEHLGEFAMYAQADSLEALGKLLNEIHEETPEDCPAHKALGLSVQEVYTCKCSLSYTQDWDECTFVHHANVKSIFLPMTQHERSELMKAQYLDYAYDMSSLTKVAGKLPEFIRQDYRDSVFKSCADDECEFKQSRKTLKLKEVPKVFVVNLVWDKRIAWPLNLAQVFFSIPFTLSLDQIYEDSPRTVHNLKGMIVFAVNHYFYCIYKNNLWYILNDNTCYMSGNGDYFYLFEYLNKMQCEPVALIYEESLTPETYNLSLQTLIQMEKGIIMCENQNYEYYSEIMNSFDPVLKSLEIHVREKYGSEYWVCTNLHINYNIHDICVRCYMPKPSVNQNSLASEEELEDGFEEEVKRHRWQCEVCNHNESSENKKCSKCNRVRENSVRCFRCRGTYPDSLKKCQDCGFVLRCSKCKSYLKLEKAMCHQCGQPVKSQECKACKIPVNPVCKSCYSWECLFCMETNKNPKKCKKCSLINHWNYISNIRTSNLKCYRCKTNIEIEDSKVCYLCEGTTANWVCFACRVVLFPHNYGCKDCHQEKWICGECGRKNSSLLNLCRH